MIKAGISSLDCLPDETGAPSGRGKPGTLDSQEKVTELLVRFCSLYS